MRSALLAGLMLLLLVARAGAAQFGEVAINLLEPFAQVPSSYGYTWMAIEFVNDSTVEKSITLRVAGEPESSMYPVATSISRSFVLAPRSRSTGTWLLPSAVTASSVVLADIDGRLQRTIVGGIPHAISQGQYSWHTHGLARYHPLLLGVQVEGPIRDGLETLNEPYTSAARGPDIRRSSTYNVWRKRLDAPWPEEWLGYSRLLAVVLTPDEWWRLSAPVRAAILEYVHAGGALHFVGEGDLGIMTRESPARLAGIESSVEGWIAARLGLGTLSLSPPDTTLDGDQWDRVLTMWERSASARMINLSAQDGESLLPVLDRSRVPARLMLLVLLLFALGIGPLNMILLARMKRRVLLFVTTPLLGFFAAAGVLAYGVLRDGFTPFVRIRAVTILDQGARTAASIAHEACFAPLTPGRGLAFDARCMVIPPCSENYWESSGRLVVDMTGPQRYRSGLVNARSPDHFRLLTVEQRRERVVLTRSDDGRVEALNGLGGGIARLLVADESGDILEATNIPVGTSAALKSAAANHTAISWDMALAHVASGSAPILCGEYESSTRVGVPRGGYIAVMNSSPFVETGFESATHLDALSVVVGRFGEE